MNDIFDKHEWKSYKNMKKLMNVYKLDLTEYKFLEFYIHTSMPLSITFNDSEVYINIFNNDVSLIPDRFKEKLINLSQIYLNYLFDILNFKELLEENDLEDDFGKLIIQNEIKDRIKEYENKNNKTIHEEFCSLLSMLIITNTEKLRNKQVIE
jgi:hypothetical protein